jgi:hypothetical protein
MSAPTTPMFRVWLGWRAAALREPGGWDKFLGHLKGVFVPATWLVMPEFGLRAYLPSVFAEDQSEDWPDETALLVYTGTTEYDSRLQRVAGRAYGLLHQAVFEFDKARKPRNSRSAWAESWPNDPAADAPVLAWYWPATAEGPVFNRAESAAVFLAMNHPGGLLPTAEDVHKALGEVDGEVVVCRDGAMSFVWLTSRGKARAAEIAAALQTGQPAWKVHAAHDAISMRRPIDKAQGVAMAAHQTLHFAGPASASCAAAT